MISGYKEAKKNLKGVFGSIVFTVCLFHVYFIARSARSGLFIKKNCES